MPAAQQVTGAQAALLAPEQGLFRPGTGSLLNAGYRGPGGEAHVYPSQEACDRCASGQAVWGQTAEQLPQ